MDCKSHSKIINLHSKANLCSLSCHIFPRVISQREWWGGTESEALQRSHTVMVSSLAWGSRDSVCQYQGCKAHQSLLTHSPSLTPFPFWKSRTARPKNGVWAKPSPRPLWHSHTTHEDSVIGAVTAGLQWSYSKIYWEYRLCCTVHFCKHNESPTDSQ